MAHRRPHRNALTLRSTATPFSSIARSTDSALNGSVPDWNATPTRNMLVVAPSPNSPAFTADAST
jgi:hypothetical protein